MKDGWAEVSREFPCCACGHSTWCTVAPERDAVKCRRVPSDKAVEQRDGTAWLHPINGASKATARKLPGKERTAPLKRDELARMMKEYRDALSPKKSAAVSRELGVSEKALHAMGTGWIADLYGKPLGAPCWPMYDGRRQLCGFRWRQSGKCDKRYKSVAGSASGLFIPSTFNATPVQEDAAAEMDCAGTGPLLILTPEGPTDAMAAWDAGFPHVVGRPSNCGGADQLAMLLKSVARQDVVLFADYDPPKWKLDAQGNVRPPFWPGWEGALRVGREILPACERLRLVNAKNLYGVKELLAGGERKIDLRDWLASRRDGADRWANVAAGILRASHYVTPQWLDAASREVDRWRRALLAKRKPEVAA